MEKKKGLLSKIFSNTRKPEGLFGRLMVAGMNGGSHAAIILKNYFLVAYYLYKYLVLLILFLVVLKSIDNILNISCYQHF